MISKSRLVSYNLTGVKISDEEIHSLQQIKKLNISKEVTILPLGGFSNKKHLKKIYFEPLSQLRKIPEGCFLNCISLESINNLPESLVSIEDKAFTNCYSLKYLVIPKSVEYVASNAFNGWQDDQTILIKKKFHFDQKCKAKVILEEDAVIKKESASGREREVSLKNYIVTAKCGHVGRMYYIPINFPIMAISAKEAAKIVRNMGRVKHDHKDAIQKVRHVSEEEYIQQIENNMRDPYLQFKSKHEQNDNIDCIKNRLVLDPAYNRKT